MLTYGTLFSGIDGFAVAFDRLGWDLRWQVEFDDFCRAVLTKHWPDVPKHADVRDVGAHNLERVDVIAGGFPCQDISLAGEGAGIGGARSGLWSEMVRVVRELRPRYVVVENVAALLGRGLGVVLGDLASCGFDAEWDCIPASAVGAPHQRDRLWLIAYPSGTRRREDPESAHGDEAPDARRGTQDHHELGGAGPQRVPAAGRDGDLPDAEGELRRAGLRAGEAGAGRRDESADVRGDVADPESQRPEGAGSTGSAATMRRRPTDTGETHGVQDADCGALQPWRVGGRAAQAGGPEWWAVEPPVGRVAHGVPNRLDQLAALGNALVPQIPEWIGQRIVEYERGRLADAA